MIGCSDDKGGLTLIESDEGGGYDDRSSKTEVKVSVN